MRSAIITQELSGSTTTLESGYGKFFTSAVLLKSLNMMPQEILPTVLQMKRVVSKTKYLFTELATGY